MNKQPAPQFAIRNLSVLSYAQGFTLWHYRANTANVADVLADGFFTGLGQHLMVIHGDIIHVSCVDGVVTIAVLDGPDGRLHLLPMQQATLLTS